MSMFGHSGELKIPPSAKQDQSAQEILRVWTNGDRQEVILKHDAWNDPAAWGLLLADIARHVARAFQEEGQNYDDVYRRVLAGLEVEVENPTDKPTGEIEK